MIQPESGPVCLLGTEYEKKLCWEILVAGSEQGIEAGQVGLRLISKGDRLTTVAKECSIGSASITDGRYELSVELSTLIFFFSIFAFDILQELQFRVFHIRILVLYS